MTVHALPVLTISKDASIRDAATLMRAENVGAIVVVDEDGQGVGMVTDRDLAVRAVAWERSPTGTTVGDVMTHPLVGIEKDQADLVTVVAEMRGRGLRRVPVLVDGKPIGLISFDDVLHDLSQWLRDLAGIQTDRLRAATSHTVAEELLDELGGGIGQVREKLREVGWKAQSAFVHELDEIRDRVRRALDQVL